MKTMEEARALVLREDEPAHPAENHTCPVCSARAWRGEALASRALVEILDERGAVTEWEATDVTEEDGDIYLTCEDGHIWIEWSREVIDKTGYDGQVALLRAETAGGVGAEGPARSPGRPNECWKEAPALGPAAAAASHPLSQPRTAPPHAGFYRSQRRQPTLHPRTVLGIERAKPPRRDRFGHYRPNSAPRPVRQLGRSQRETEELPCRKGAARTGGSLAPGPSRHAPHRTSAGTLRVDRSCSTRADREARGSTPDESRFRP